MLVQEDTPSLQNNFPKVYRLLTKHDYQVVFHQGKRVYGHHFCLIYKFNSLNKMRLGIIIGKKKVAKAVSRNQFKRAIREHFRVRKSDCVGIDIVVFLKNKPQVSKDKFPLREDLQQVWLKFQRGLKKA